MSEEWSVHVSEKDGALVSLRLNENIAEYVCHPEYAFFLGLSVSFRQALASGFPGDDEKNILNELENLILEQLVNNMLCVLGAVITANGSREFAMYTYSPEQCKKTLLILNETWMHHDIKFTLQEDPSWDVFETFLM